LEEHERQQRGDNDNERDIEKEMKSVGINNMNRHATRQGGSTSVRISDNKMRRRVDNESMNNSVQHTWMMSVWE
jgi:hypothetical protein